MSACLVTLTSCVSQLCYDRDRMHLEGTVRKGETVAWAAWLSLRNLSFAQPNCMAS